MTDANQVGEILNVSVRKTFMGDCIDIKAIADGTVKAVQFMGMQLYPAFIGREEGNTPHGGWTLQDVDVLHLWHDDERSIHDITISLSALYARLKPLTPHVPDITKRSTNPPKSLGELVAEHVYESRQKSAEEPSQDVPVGGVVAKPESIRDMIGRRQQELPTLEYIKENATLINHEYLQEQLRYWPDNKFLVVGVVDAEPHNILLLHNAREGRYYQIKLLM